MLGTTTGTEGDGTLGQATFEVQPGFRGETEITVSYVSLRQVEGEQLRYTTRSVATISAEAEVVTLPGDFDGDGQVNFNDFFLFADGFGTMDPKYDLNASGLVDFDDFFIFADNFGNEERAKLIALAIQYIGLPHKTALAPNYPNPFNSSTTIRYTASQRGVATLGVYDLNGQLVKRLYSDSLPAGRHEIAWDGRDNSGHETASGVYIVRLSVGSAVDTQKIMLVK